MGEGEGGEFRGWLGFGDGVVGWGVGGDEADEVDVFWEGRGARGAGEADGLVAGGAADGGGEGGAGRESGEAELTG